MDREVVCNAKGNQSKDFFCVQEIINVLKNNYKGLKKYLFSDSCVPFCVK